MIQKQISNKTLAFTREGSQVTRCHTNIQDGKYTVGQHSFNALNLVLLYHPNPSLNLIKAVAWHDLAERHVGDVPSPILKRFPALDKAYKEAEAAVFEHYGLEIPYLNAGGIDASDDFSWYLTVDKLELLLWAIEQYHNGNTRYAEFIEALRLWAQEFEVFIPQQLKHLFFTYTGERNKDLLNFEGENDA